MDQAKARRGQLPADAIPGCFREYNYKYKHVEDPHCVFCEGSVENARHVLMECARFGEARRRLELLRGGPITPGSLTSCMLTSKEAWNEANVIICRVMRTMRRDEERARNRDDLRPQNML